MIVSQTYSKVQLVLLAVVLCLSTFATAEGSKDADAPGVTPDGGAARISKDDPNWRRRQEIKQRQSEHNRGARIQALSNEGLSAPVLAYKDFALYAGQAEEFVKEETASNWDCIGTIRREEVAVLRKAPQKTKTEPKFIYRCTSPVRDFDMFNADYQQAMAENHQQPPSRMKSAPTIAREIAEGPKFRDKLCARGKLHFEYQSIIGPIGQNTIYCEESRAEETLCAKGWSAQVTSQRAPNARAEVVVCSRVTNSCPNGYQLLPASLGGNGCYRCPRTTELDTVETAAFNEKLANTTSRVGTYFYRTGERLLCRGPAPTPKGAVQFQFGACYQDSHGVAPGCCYVYEGDEIVGDTINTLRTEAGPHKYRVECIRRDPVEFDIDVPPGNQITVTDPKLMNKIER